MADLDDLFGEDVIDRDCLRLTLEDWLTQPDGEPMRVFYVPAVHVLACGHRRPTNQHAELGTLCPCALCEVRVEIVATELLREPTAFAHPEALSDLRSVA